MLSPLASFRRRLLAWYDRHRRDMPWRAKRGQRPDPYRVLVSEVMLQQTQVATATPYYLRFIEQFPTLADLAAADEQAVLRAWQGLGYYSRARNLQRAAREVMSRRQGVMPNEVAELMELPGVGRYTAGAVASLAFGHRAAILDGNVSRVLCRLDMVEADPRQPAIARQLWARAEQLLPPRPGARCGDFNSALMDLGATVCTPRQPACAACPVRPCCEAHAHGLQGAIPRPRQAKATGLHHREIHCIRRQHRRQTQWLLEQRPATGRWASMWQFIALRAADASAPPVERIRRATGLRVTDPLRLGQIRHALSHRRYVFAVYACLAVAGKAAQDRPRRWVSAEALSAYPLPKPHLTAAQMTGLAPPQSTAR